MMERSAEAAKRRGNHIHHAHASVYETVEINKR